jgi:SAM-dependent methyltransferase
MPDDDGDYLIPPPGRDEPDTGKTLSALGKSRDGKGALIQLFGGRERLPSSIMKKKRRTTDPGDPANERRYIDSLPAKHKEALGDRNLGSDLKSMWGMAKGSRQGALSSFHHEICRTCILFYSEPGDVVLDPFCGRASVMSLCAKTGRDFIGCDLSDSNAESNAAKAVKLMKCYPHRRLKYHHCDSRHQPIRDGVGDLLITSPPYWRIEDYGPEPEQLGKRKTYEDFLGDLELVMAENYRTLKPGAFVVYAVNDFRENGKFIMFHADTARLLGEVGFVPWDLMVVDLGPCLRDGFVNQTFETKILPKRHEYLIVFRKPESE